jgi:hypothetical protein
MKQMLDLYLRKYNEGSEFLVLKSLSWFDDAEADEMPVMLKFGNWDTIKTVIKTSLENYIRNRI